MAGYNVEYKDKWAFFSNIIEDFLIEFMNRKDYEEWRTDKYGENLRPIECNVRTMEEVAFRLRMNRTSDEAVECLLECGLSEEDSKQIIYDIDTEYYCPIQNDNGTYKCPNCREEVDFRQAVCSYEGCEIELVWRK